MTAVTAAAASPTGSAADIDSATRKSCRSDRDPVGALIAALDNQTTVVSQLPPTPPQPLQSLPGREGALDYPAYWHAGLAPFRALDYENLILLADFDCSELVLPDLLPYSPPASIYHDAALAPRGDPAQALEDRAFRLFCNENICLVMRASQHQLVTVTRAVATLRRIWDDDVAAAPLSIFSQEYCRRAYSSVDRDDDEDMIDDDSAWFADAAAALPAFPAPFAVDAAAKHELTAPPPPPPAPAYRPIAPAKTASPLSSPSLPKGLVQPPPAMALLPATRRGGARRRAPSSSSGGGSASSRPPRELAFHDFDPSKAGRRNSAPSLRREYRRRASVNSRAAKGLQDVAVEAAAATAALVKQAPSQVVAPVSNGGSDASKAYEDATVVVSDVVRLMQLMSAEMHVSDGGSGGGGVAVGSRTPDPLVEALAPMPTAADELPPSSPLFLQGPPPFGGGWKVHEPSSSRPEVLPAVAPAPAPDPQPLLLWDAIDASLRLGASGLEPEALLFM
ncbi:hypothetical protein HK405_011529 [Cladochytrium tenue]|nr:hypothetical protein HK405_011529 [Cladochytrium tenue]